MKSITATSDVTPCLVVYTCRGIERILREGGSQAWRISSSHAGKMRYIVCIQNRNLDWGNASHPHGSAFLIGKISEIRKVSVSPKGVIRKIVEISEYAEVNIPCGWQNGRNPIAYMKLGELGLTLDELEFKPVCSAQETMRIDGRYEDDDENEAQLNALEDDEEGLTIDQAKRRLAIGLGVGVDKIEILIRA
ncbi:hypothetical protein [Stutzerimonas kunmingensis]|uniref:hypothetical protein n=1 Tax=Stutzerimonas kunmingensis TaxID=1211807 RepID=UPI00241DF2F1|nr:hypothetical protein [Stutzerimonas kunmingensis]